MAILDPASVRSSKELTLDDLLIYAVSQKASDIFLKVGSPPGLRILGRIVKPPLPILDAEDTVRLASEHMTPDMRMQFEQTHELNLSFSVPGVIRIRQNVYQERDNVATTCRLIPLKVKSLDEIGVHSQAIRSMTDQANGLVLVTGPTGSGKTTTLAGMIDYINENRPVNIVTMEDPIEYVYSDKLALISQRQIGVDTASFAEALKQVLRQTPDVILIGEMRDMETINIALEASETGHLVFGTLHTASAPETLDRISNMYAPHERPMLWLRLSGSLRGVVSQKLVKKADDSGRVVAQEIMVTSPTIEKLLKDGSASDLYAAIRQDGLKPFWGMQTMNQALEGYVMEGVITEEDALAKAGNLTELKQSLRQNMMIAQSMKREENGEEECGLTQLAVVSAGLPQAPPRNTFAEVSGE
ncbi:MAG: pilus retraction protein PilT [Chthonomonadaceae bacterium]|nr:pilus retraction protein PilT [Chthonomonadaceae bacterium]